LGQPVDTRSDIFSFGLVLYEMLSGKRAFSDDTPLATLAAIVKDEPAPLAGAGGTGTHRQAVSGEAGGTTLSDHGRSKDCLGAGQTDW
jgi:serine/threonine protein kinase